MEPLSFDTTFLIELQREKARSGDGPAHEFLRLNRSSPVRISATVLGEFAEGFKAGDRRLDDLRRSFSILPIDTEVALRYGILCRTLRAKGELIGTNDLWIAATSLRYDLPLVTGNSSHFRRIAGLRMIAY